MNKLVFVTGAGRGIGRAIAIKLAKDGFAVYGCSRTESELEETRRLSDGKICVSATDVTDQTKLQSWFESACDLPNTIPWGLVTAAGIFGPLGPFLKNDWEEWKRGVEINLYGSLLATKYFSSLLISKGAPGRIVHLSGGGATKPIRNFSSYCASKAALVRTSETLALELQPYSITVNAISPGLHLTKMTEKILEIGEDLAGDEMYKSIQKESANRGKEPMQALELVTYLMSEEASTITGRLISAEWDKWSGLHENRHFINHRDLYTLRRLTM